MRQKSKNRSKKLMKKLRKMQLKNKETNQMPAKKLTTVKKVVAKKPVVKKPSLLSIPVYSLTGRSAGTLALPKETFGKEINKKLLAQAVRVYTTNQKTFTASTKSRGEVERSSVKIYRQKGTGRARHGPVKAPI